MPASQTPPAAPPAKAAAPSKPAAPPPPAKPAAAKPSKADIPPVSPPPEKDPGDWMGDIAADLDKLSAEDDAKQAGKGRPAPPAKPPEKSKVGAPTEPEPEPEPSPEPEPGHEPEPEPEPVAGEEPPAEPQGLLETRHAYKSLKKKIASELHPKIQKLEARIKELETTTPEESKAFQERFEKAETERKRLENILADIDYRESDEFKTKYQKPYIDAWNSALSDLSEIQVENADGTLRTATDKDLVEIANLPLGSARAKAKLLFGDAADDMMLHRRKILDLAKAQNEAIDARKKEAETRAKTQAADAKAAQERVSQMWSESVKTLETRFPAMFSKVEGDTEGNALLEKGQAQADSLFRPTDENRPKSADEAVHGHALFWHKIRNHDRLAFWLKKTREELKEAKAELEKYENSEPKGGQGGRPAPAGDKDFMAEANAEIDGLERSDI